MTTDLALDTPVQTTQSISMLCMAGDVIITWDEHNKDAVLDYAAKKMAEGVSFYILKPKKVFGQLRDNVRHKVTEDNFETVVKGSKGIVVPDESLNELMAASVDRGIRVRRRPRDEPEHEIVPGSRVKDPKQLLGKESVGLAPVAGG